MSQNFGSRIVGATRCLVNYAWAAIGFVETTFGTSISEWRRETSTASTDATTLVTLTGWTRSPIWEDVTSAENIFSRSSLVAAHSVRWRAPGPVFWPVRAILDRRAKD